MMKKPDAKNWREGAAPAARLTDTYKEERTTMRTHDIHSFGKLMNRVLTEAPVGDDSFGVHHVRLQAI